MQRCRPQLAATGLIRACRGGGALDRAVHQRRSAIQGKPGAYRAVQVARTGSAAAREPPLGAADPHAVAVALAVVAGALMAGELLPSLSR